MNLLGKIVSFVVAMLVFFILPASYHAQKQEAIIQVYVQTETQKFVDMIRSNGYLNERMYTSFLSALNSTGNLYKITMDHAHKITDTKLDEYGQVEEYYEYKLSTYENEILKTIYQKNDKYRMTQGDYLSVRVQNQTDTYRDFFDRLLYGANPSVHGIVASAGGKILDEIPD